MHRHTATWGEEERCFQQALTVVQRQHASSDEPDLAVAAAEPAEESACPARTDLQLVSWCSACAEVMLDIVASQAWG